MNKKNNKKFLFVGTTTTILGNKIFDFANNFLISKISPKTSFVLALYQSSELIISILLNLIGGAISDFTSKKNKIVIISDFLSGIFVLSILFLQKNKFTNVCCNYFSKYIT